MDDCCNNKIANASSNSSGTAIYDTVITTSASATASSKTYEAAYIIAKDVSQQVADSLAKTSVNIMNQTIDVINTNIIAPINEEIVVLNKFKNSAISKQNITLNGVVDSMYQFVNNNYQINWADSLINQYTTEIQNNDVGPDPSLYYYNGILRPIFEEKYININDPATTVIVKTYPNTTIFYYYYMRYVASLVGRDPNTNKCNNLTPQEMLDNGYITQSEYEIIF